MVQKNITHSAKCAADKHNACILKVSDSVADFEQLPAHSEADRSGGGRRAGRFYFGSGLAHGSSPLFVKAPMVDLSKKTKKTIAAVAILTCLSGCHALGYVLVDTGYKVRERLTPIDEKAWQPIRHITVFSWYQGGNLVPEELPGHRSYVVPLRYKANGIVTPHSDESLQKLGQKLLSRYPDLERFRAAGATADSKPLYFIDKRVFIVSVDPPVMAVVPAKFVTRRGVLLSKLTTGFGRREVEEGYQSFREKEQAMGMRPKRHSIPHWANDLEFSSVIPKADAIEVISPLWPKPVALEAALADDRLRFEARDAPDFPGYMSIQPRDLSQGACGSGLRR